MQMQSHNMAVCSSTPGSAELFSSQVVAPQVSRNIIRIVQWLNHKLRNAHNPFQNSLRGALVCIAVDRCRL